MEEKIIEGKKAEGRKGRRYWQKEKNVDPKVAKREKEEAYRKKLAMASYCPKVSGQAWSHVGKEK